MEWTSTSILVWFFPRQNIPPSIAIGRPDPSQFGTPSATFQGACDIDSLFSNHSVVFDTTFCGSYAGSVYASSSCPQTTGKDSMGSCVDYVANHPEGLAEAYWLIGSMRVYQQAFVDPELPLPGLVSQAPPPQSKLTSAASISASLADGGTSSPSTPTVLEPEVAVERPSPVAAEVPAAAPRQPVVVETEMAIAASSLTVYEVSIAIAATTTALESEMPVAAPTPTSESYWESSYGDEPIDVYAEPDGVYEGWEDSHLDMPLVENSWCSG